MFPVKWFWCHFSIMKSISLSFQVITEAQIQEGHGLDTFQVQGWQHSGGHTESNPWCPMSGQCISWRPRHSSCSLLHRVCLHPDQRDRQTETLCFLGTPGIHCSTAGKLNLGLTRCRHRSNTKILEDILHIPGTAPPQKIPPLYEDTLWGLNEH